MFCPYCGTEITEKLENCPNCKMELPKEETHTTQTDAVPETQQKKKRKLPYVLYVIYRILKFAAFAALAYYVYQEFLTAADSISRGGRNISYIQSVGGKTLEEAYYAELGHVYSGYATFTRALGNAISGILVGLGLTK